MVKKLKVIINNVENIPAINLILPNTLPDSDNKPCLLGSVFIESHKRIQYARNMNKYIFLFFSASISLLFLLLAI